MISVTILGASSAKPTANGHPSAQVVNCNEQYYLVDAGEGVQIGDQADQLIVA